MYNLRRRSNNILSCVWWFYCSFDVRIQTCHCFPPSLRWMAAWRSEQRLHACFRFKSTTEWSAGPIISHKRVFWEASSSTQRSGFFKRKTDDRNKMRWTSMFSYFNHLKSLAAVLTSCYRDFAMVMSRVASQPRPLSPSFEPSRVAGWCGMIPSQLPAPPGECDANFSYGENFPWTVQNAKL